MKNFPKLLSTSLTTLLLFNTTSYATSLSDNIIPPKDNLSITSSIKLLDLKQENLLTSDDYNAIITNEENLDRSLNLSNELNTPIFIETSDYSINKIASYFNLQVDSKENSISPQEDLELKGYLIYKDNAENIEPWFVEKGLNDTLFTEDLKSKIKNIESSTSVELMAAAWPVADSYATNISYTEASVGVSGILYDSGSSKPTGQQDMIVEVTPRSTTYTDYSTDYFTTQLSFTNGTVLDYSPDNNYGKTSIGISYPWGISTNFELGGTFDVTKTGGGVGYNNATWKFDPNNNSSYNNLKGKVTAQFSSSSKPLKSSIGTYITLRTTSKVTGASSTRTVNYNTTFSGK